MIAQILAHKGNNTKTQWLAGKQRHHSVAGNVLVINV